MKVKLAQKVNLGVTFISFSLKIHLRFSYQKNKKKKIGGKIAQACSLESLRIVHLSLVNLGFFNVVSI